MSDSHSFFSEYKSLFIAGAAIIGSCVLLRKVFILEQQIELKNRQFDEIIKEL